MNTVFDLVLENAKVALRPNPFSPYTQEYVFVQKNIGVSKGRIASISDAKISGSQSLDCTGLTILPGLIDTQVHFRDPGLTYKEDIESGSRAAALGGICGFFDMPNTIPTTTSVLALNDKLEQAQKKSWVNFAFYGGGSPQNIKDLPSLENTVGCAGIKVFMGSSTGSLLIPDDATLEAVLRSGRRRVAIHAEDEERLKARKTIAEKSHNIEDHPHWRDVETAVLATQRILKLARKTGRPVHILHVTTAEEVELLKANKDIATFEITPNHLFFQAPDCYRQWGTKVQMNPPIREQRHRLALWKAVREGANDVIGTDHAPHTLAEKSRQYPASPSGMPGVQTVLPLLLDSVAKAEISLSRVIEMLSFQPARIFGIRGKGLLTVGADADFTIVDLKKQFVIEDSWIASKVGWTPFAGRKVQGLPWFTIVGGEIVMAEGKVVPGQNGKAKRMNLCF
jgi:dihydroorotase